MPRDQRPTTDRQGANCRLQNQDPNLTVRRIDYKKAYVTVPHSWIIQSMELHKIDQKIINLLQQSMGNWNTALTSGGKHLANIKIKWEIFQGDALSPLLKTNHLLYMDDLNLYAKNEDLTALIETVRIFTTDICTETSR